MNPAFFLILFLGSLYADIEDHFKKINDKAGFHQMRNIDFIYTINLDQRPEKFQACVNQLSFHGIEPYRFSAVNGWELSLGAINELGVKYMPWMPTGWATYYLLEGDPEPHHEMLHEVGRNYFSHCMSRGAIGIVLSHLSILQDAYDSGHKTIWVMEDDIEIVQNPHLLSDLVDKLDALVGEEGWDILFTDQDTKSNNGMRVPCLAFAARPNYFPTDPKKFAEKQDISEEFKQIGARYGAYSMIVRRSGMEKILKFFKNYQIFLPFDMEYTLPPDIHLYSLREDIVTTQISAPSDNGAPNYEKK
jgi:GR25 family glycosyltransferase involved in LPS biosynthesis